MRGPSLASPAQGTCDSDLQGGVALVAALSPLAPAAATRAPVSGTDFGFHTQSQGWRIGSFFGAPFCPHPHCLMQRWPRARGVNRKCAFAMNLPVNVPQQSLDGPSAQLLLRGWGLVLHTVTGWAQSRRRQQCPHEGGRCKYGAFLAGLVGKGAGLCQHRDPYLPRGGRQPCHLHTGAPRRGCGHTEERISGGRGGCGLGSFSLNLFCNVFCKKPNSKKKDFEFVRSQTPKMQSDPQAHRRRVAGS